MESKNLKILNLWIELQEKGIVVEDVAVDVNSCTLDMDDFKTKLTENTKEELCRDIVAFKEGIVPNS
ncbi:MAG: hypothetical protein JSV31_05020 [Desulfobacterales bacterium]|nr:MAG: hypothetical protein JSV31_05020 [Desulfobacterales bacterium]